MRRNLTASSYSISGRIAIICMLILLFSCGQTCSRGNKVRRDLAGYTLGASSPPESKRLGPKEEQLTDGNTTVTSYNGKIAEIQTTLEFSNQEEVLLKVGEFFEKNGLPQMRGSKRDPLKKVVEYLLSGSNTPFNMNWDDGKTSMLVALIGSEAGFVMIQDRKLTVAGFKDEYK